MLPARDLAVPAGRRDSDSCENGRVATIERAHGDRTHEVLNQVPPLDGYNVFDADRVLAEALRREGAEWAEDDARELGAICGRADTLASKPWRTT